MAQVVGAAIVRDGRVLAARRTTPPEPAGRWELPGGKVEPGETAAAALVREIGEELGCRGRSLAGWLAGRGADRPAEHIPASPRWPGWSPASREPVRARRGRWLGPRRARRRSTGWSRTGPFLAERGTAAVRATRGCRAPAPRLAAMTSTSRAPAAAGARPPRRRVDRPGRHDGEVRRRGPRRHAGDLHRRRDGRDPGPRARAPRRRPARTGSASTAAASSPTR